MRFLISGLLVCALVSEARDSPANAVRPVIYARDDEAALAMKSAALILLVEVTAVKLSGDVRAVDKPPGIGGPTTSTISLRLARIRAKVLLAVRGPARSNVEFYSWVWASGQHGGPRLFHPAPGSHHVIFLRQDGGYLHTVGDYPAYDLELQSRWLPALISAWNSGRDGGADLLERLVSLRLRAEFEGLPASDLRATFTGNSRIPRDYYMRDLTDLVRLDGPFFVATQLDDICRNSKNQFGRIASCDVTAREFPGRCQAYRLMREADSEGITGSFVTRVLDGCEAEERDQIRRLRSNDLPMRGFYGWSLTPEHRRGAMRLYASAMDLEFHVAACEVAASMPEARDIPECSLPRRQ